MLRKWFDKEIFALILQILIKPIMNTEGAYAHSLIYDNLMSKSCARLYDNLMSKSCARLYDNLP